MKKHLNCLKCEWEKLKFLLIKKIGIEKLCDLLIERLNMRKNMWKYCNYLGVKSRWYHSIKYRVKMCMDKIDKIHNSQK